MPEWKRSSDKKYVKRTNKEENEIIEENEDLKQDEEESNESEYTKVTSLFDNKQKDDHKMVGIMDEDEERITPDQDDFDFDDDNVETDYEYNKIHIGKVLLVVFFIAVFVLGIYFGVKNFNNSSEVNTIETNTVTEPKTLTSSISGFKVLGKIKIEKFGIEQYILNSTSEDALDLGVGYIDNGASINNYGNFAIAGHNVEGVFEKLSELEVGDKFILIDKNLEETTYVVTSKSTVDPSNLECLLQDESKIEVTLITCQIGATERLVIKAEEEDSIANSQDTQSTNEVITNTIENSVN